MANNEMYQPIPEQLEKLGESPVLADPTVVEGFRILIKDGVTNGFFSSNDGDGLLRKLQVVEALNLLHEKGIIDDK